MKNNILRKLMLIAVLLTGSNVFAHDFEAQNIEGVTIYYNIISATDLTCEVTYRGSSVDEYSGEYTGTVVIPTSVTNGENTYSVTSIGMFAFRDCSGLASVTIGNSVTSIGEGAFHGCNGLTSVYITDLEAWCKMDFVNSSATPFYYADELYLNNKLVTKIEIPNTITIIKNYAFYGCEYLNSITIPNSVTSIGESAFGGCSGLTSVTIGNSVTSIGIGAFGGCSGLTSVTIPNSVTSIGMFAFRDCSGLASVTIGNSVTSIGEGAFHGCSGLTSVVIPNSVTSIGMGAFYSCSSLTSVTIPNSVTSIGVSAFYSCSSLTSVTIPNSVTSIGNSAFYNCTGLTSVTIGSGVNTIEAEAFSGCSSLSVINSLSINAPTTSTFDAKTQMEATLRIPKGSLASYQATDGWKEFWNIVEVENLEDVLNGAVTTYNVNANYDSAQGSVSINGTTGTFASVNADSEIEFVITPNAGYAINKVTLNGTDVTADVVDNKYTVAKATEDITFAVTFKKQTFALELKCSEAGAFKRILNYGETATYEIAPSENWEINTVTFNGTDVTTELVDNVFTTPEITEDSELSVVFVDLASSVFSVYNTSDVKVYVSQQTISIKGLEDNTPVAVYNSNGQMEYSKVATDYEMNINMNKNGVYLVKVGEKTFKVML